MTTLAPAPPDVRAERGRECSAQRLFDELGGGPTLDELIARVWEGLTAHRPVRCPVCGADMNPVYGAHALPIGGRCTNCGTALR